MVRRLIQKRGGLFVRRKRYGATMEIQPIFAGEIERNRSILITRIRNGDACPHSPARFRVNTSGLTKRRCGYSRLTDEHSIGPVAENGNAGWTAFARSRLNSAISYYHQTRERHC